MNSKSNFNTNNYIAGSSEDVRKNIQYVRKLRGYTQKQMADKMGVTQSAISQFEQSGSIQFDTLVRIGEVLNVNHLILYMHDLHDEQSMYHDIIENVIKTYPNGEQFIKVMEEAGHELEQRRISMYTGKTVSPEEAEIIDLFDKLNVKGQREAVKRIEELAQLPEYKKED